MTISDWFIGFPPTYTGGINSNRFHLFSSDIIEKYCKYVKINSIFLPVQTTNFLTIYFRDLLDKIKLSGLDDVVRLFILSRRFFFSLKNVYCLYSEN